MSCTASSCPILGDEVVPSSVLSEGQWTKIKRKALRVRSYTVGSSMSEGSPTSEDAPPYSPGNEIGITEPPAVACTDGLQRANGTFGVGCAERPGTPPPSYEQRVRDDLHVPGAEFYGERDATEARDAMEAGTDWEPPESWVSTPGNPPLGHVRSRHGTVEGEGLRPIRLVRELEERERLREREANMARNGRAGIWAHGWVGGLWV